MKNPIDLLPLKPPREEEFKEQPLFFYENVAKPLVQDTIRLMSNGLPINLDRVEELEVELDGILLEVQNTINNNKFIKDFQDYKFPIESNNLREEIESKMRSPEYYLKEFTLEGSRAMINRSYYMEVFLEQHAEELYDLITPIEEVAPGISKWKTSDLKTLAETYHEIQKLVKKRILPTEPTAIEAMKRLAEDSSRIYNKAYKDKISDISFDTVIKPFNPASSTQKKEFFDWLGIEPLAYSKETGEASWGRDQIEELQRVETDTDLLDLYQAFIDHSFAAIVRDNFINAFYKYTILHDDGIHRLHGNYKLLGAKTG